MDILQSLKKQVTFQHIAGDGPLLDMGVTSEEIAEMKQRGPLSRPVESRRQLAEFKAQFAEGDELWYYEWRKEPFWGTGGYAIIRDGAVVASITSWRS
jgi:hypothetical protein